MECFRFAAGPLPHGTYDASDQPEIREPASVIIVDGAYSARPELDYLVDLSFLVDVSAGVRHQRLAERKAPDFLAAWHSDEAEA